ncbi:MAG TPA: diaminopimelate epimerase [Thermodesulfobacteriota bacterium]|nr:diaminopimelate epimerase [Thermodesulfobacteriota bacterium]
MKISFTKMHGLGNDFIILDCRVKNIPNLQRVVKRLSHRRFGVGFDQALVLKKSARADFRMDIYNSDGSRVEMCGNGIRCLANYIWNRGISRKKTLEIETLAGIMRPERAGGLVRVDMGEPVLEGSLIPTRAEGIVRDRPLKALDRVFKINCVSMGNPHCVIFVDDVEAFPVEKYGPAIETDRFFPRRTNVEFIQVVSRKTLAMRVWERGSGETLACGTGASASAVVSHMKGFTGRTVNVELKGGRLRIEWARDGRVYMTGPAEEVFTGEFAS